MRWLVALVVASCIAAPSCRRPRDESPIAPDPAPRDASPPKSPAPLGDPSLVLLHGRVIDPVAARVTFTLVPTPPLPKLEASKGDRGYAFGATNLDAFDLRRGNKLWSVAASCSVLVALDVGALCASIRDLFLYDASTGAVRALASTGSADVQQLLAVSGHVLVLRGDGTIESFDDRTLAEIGSSKLPFVAVGFDPLAANVHGACVASSPSRDVELACLDTSAKIERITTHALVKPTDPTLTSFIKRQLDERFFVVASWFGPMRRGVVVRVADGVEVARVEQEITSAVARADGSLEGMLVTNPETRFLEPSGAVRWTSKVRLDDSTSVLSFGDALVVASFDPIATGATLHAFDLATGATRWTGDVALEPITHSVYLNDVVLSLRGGRVAMRGKEAAQDYLELFDPRDGSRVFKELVTLW
jgi:hypothetical protein